MMTKNKLVKILAALAISTVTFQTHAMSIDWEGTYRFEWMQIDRPTLGAPSGAKAYGLNYLSLSPKIIAADGVNIISRFDVLPNADPTYQDDNYGQLFGEGSAFSLAGNNYGNNVNSQSRKSSNLKVQQLYLNINQEYGAFVVGRAPIEFGLGITHNAGNGAFDHFSDTRDLVAYKFIVDNFFVMPIFARVQNSIGNGQQIQDMIIHAQYESKESGSLIGLMHQTRKASQAVNDAPLLSPTNSNASEYNVQTISFILGRDWEAFGFKLEAGVNSGGIGQKTATNEDVKSSGYGVAADLYFPKRDSKWNFGLKLGMATGDDPTSVNAYEGFQFDRNYDVAMMLFNHRLGTRDFLTTNSIKDTTKDASNSLDDEAISNAMFVAPKATYAWNERLDLSNTLIYGQVMTNPVTANANFQKDLGFEWDIELAYRPTDRIQWVNQVGLLFPGKAFKNGDNATGNLESATAIGFASKVAISF